MGHSLTTICLTVLANELCTRDSSAAHNFIGREGEEEEDPRPSPRPPLPFFTLILECVFESAGCVFEHQWRHTCECLLSLFFPEIKRNNRGMGGDKLGAGVWGGDGGGNEAG